MRLIYNFFKHGGKLNKGMAFIMEGLARNQGSIDATKIEGVKEGYLNTIYLRSSLRTLPLAVLGRESRNIICPGNL